MSFTRYYIKIGFSNTFKWSKLILNEKQILNVYNFRLINLWCTNGSEAAVQSQHNANTISIHNFKCNNLVSMSSSSHHLATMLTDSVTGTSIQIAVTPVPPASDQDPSSEEAQEYSREAGHLSDQQCSKDAGLLSDQQCSRDAELLSDQQCSKDAGHLSDQPCSRDAGLLSDQQCSREAGHLSDQQCSRDAGHLSDQQCSKDAGHLSDQQCSRDAGHLSEDIPCYSEALQSLFNTSEEDLFERYKEHKKLDNSKIDYKSSPKKKKQKSKKRKLDDNPEESEKRNKRPNYFIGIPISNPVIHCNIVTVQECMVAAVPALAQCLVDVATSHLTLFVCHISPDQLALASSCLEQFGCEYSQQYSTPPLVLTFQGLGHFRNKVVYASVQQDAELERLQQLCVAVRKVFVERGVAVQQEEEADWSPHLTVAKLSKTSSKKAPRKIASSTYETHVAVQFGQAVVTRVELLAMTKPKDEHRYFHCDGHCSLGVDSNESADHTRCCFPRRPLPASDLLPDDAPGADGSVTSEVTLTADVPATTCDGAPVADVPPTSDGAPVTDVPPTTCDRAPVNDVPPTTSDGASN